MVYVSSHQVLKRCLAADPHHSEEWCRAYIYIYIYICHTYISVCVYVGMYVFMDGSMHIYRYTYRLFDR